jgi:RNA polymerase sigma-70 factor, ECF subfamily
MRAHAGDTLRETTEAAQPPREPCGEDPSAVVRRFCRGDRTALAALVRLWEHRLLTIAYRVVGNLHDAEDVRQMVLLKLATTSDRPDDPERFAGWLRRCVVNESISWIRGRRPETRRRETFDEGVAATGPSPSEEAAAAERSRRLQAALDQLEPDARVLLSLRFDEGMTIRQIGEAVGRSPMTVHGQINRAVRRLRQRLGAKFLEEVTQ